MLHPWNAGPHTGMGQALFTLGRYDESLDEFRRACDADPRSQWAHRALAQTLRRRHQYAEALERIKSPSASPYNQPTRWQHGAISSSTSLNTGKRRKSTRSA